MTDERLPVAVDAMGGDDAPATIVAGARLAEEKYGVRSLLVGDPERLGDIGSLEVIPASQVIEMGAEPASSVRRMKDSSIVRAAEAVRDGRASALLSAGNTGAAMAASLLRMGRIKGVSRPAIAVPFPVVGSSPTTVLDCGANADCQPEWLVQFAVLGTVYARTCFNLEKPRVGILTIGEEAGKGNALVKEACELLETTGWAVSCGADYLGNLEGRDLMSGSADVVVTDGFTGNVVLKSLEGGFAMFESAVREAVRPLGSPEAVSPEAVSPEAVPPKAVPPEAQSVTHGVEPALQAVFDTFDAREKGAAQLLGTRGVALISHGSSSSATVANAIATADELVDIGIVEELRAALAERASW